MSIIAKTSSPNNLNWENAKQACLDKKPNKSAASTGNYGRPSMLVKSEAKITKRLLRNLPEHSNCPKKERNSIVGKQK